MEALVSTDQHLLLWVVLVLVSLFGMISEKRKWFGKLAGVLVTILTMAVLSSFGFIPSASDPDLDVPTYRFVVHYLLPMAIPLLLFNADIRRIMKESGRLLTVYLLGSASVVIGALVAFYIINLGEEGFKVVGVFIATLIGGSVNFMATAETFGFTQSKLFPATIAVDNFVVSLFVFLLFVVPTIKILGKFFPSYQETESIPPATEQKGEVHFDLIKLTSVLAIAGIVCACGFWLGPLIGQWTGADINFNILVITTVILVIANSFPRHLTTLSHTAHEVGMVLMYLFLGVIGAACNPRDIFIEGPRILIFCLITLFVHLAILLFASRYLKVSLKEIAVASAANIGGPTIAAPMAASMNAHKLITPGILVGVLGYVIGTAIGVSVGLWVR